MSSPTQRTLEEMRRRGYAVDIVERWLSFARRPGSKSRGVRKDFMGFVDVIAIGDREVIAIQTTSRACIPAHIKKIESDELATAVAAVRRGGIRILLHGWWKQRGRWHVKEIELS